MKSLRNRYAALYNFTYMSIGALLPLIGQYLKSIGFTGTQIGTVTATGTAVAIFASTFWGGRYSRSRKKHEILMVLCAMAAVVCFVLMNVKVYAVFIVIFGLMYFFQAPIMSLTDAFTVESGQGFGNLRAWGAVGFALGTFLAGICVKALDLSIIFLFYIVSFAVAAFIVKSIKKHDTVKRNTAVKEGKSFKGYLRVLQHKKLRQLIICAFFLGGTNVANNTYFSFLYIEGGGTVAGVGIAMLFMVGSEVPFMAWCEKLSRKFTMERIIAAAMLISVVRFILYGMGLPWWLLIAISFSQGAVNGILLVEFVRYAAKLAPAGYESLAISSYYIISSNLSTICCQFFGGLILDHIGAAGVYTFFGLFNLCGLILYFLFKLNKVSDEKS